MLCLPIAWLFSCRVWPSSDNLSHYLGTWHSQLCCLCPTVLLLTQVSELLCQWGWWSICSQLLSYKPHTSFCIHQVHVCLGFGKGIYYSEMLLTFCQTFLFNCRSSASDANCCGKLAARWMISSQPWSGSQGHGFGRLLFSRDMFPVRCKDRLSVGTNLPHVQQFVQSIIKPTTPMPPEYHNQKEKRFKIVSKSGGICGKTQWLRFQVATL